LKLGLGAYSGVYFSSRGLIGLFLLRCFKNIHEGCCQAAKASFEGMRRQRPHDLCPEGIPEGKHRTAPIAMNNIMIYTESE